MIVLLQCLAQAVADKGLPGLASMVPGGEFACSVATDAWKKYRERKKDAEIRDEIRQLAEANFEEARKAAVEAVRAAVPSAPDADRLNLVMYLSQVPGTVRASLKRPEDATGKTVPPTFGLNSPDDVVKLLPPRPPRFKPNDPVPGLAGWYLVEPLGAGGFGEVWLAKHRSASALSRAVKYCLGQHARDLQHENDLINRVMAAGEHPNIVPLRDIHLEGDTPWLMYDYVHGGDLTGIVLQLRTMKPEQRVAQVLGILKQLAGAVAHFHRLTPAIVHRDLKPNNILIRQEGGQGRRLLITDFGIGAVTSKSAIRGNAKGGTSTGRLLSHLRGSYTPLYSSPQQREGNDPDPRDDVHALGVIAFQLCTGQLTHGPGSDFSHDLREVGVSEPLIELIGRCVARNPALRPATGSELLQQIQSLACGPSPVSRSGSGAAIPVAVVPPTAPRMPTSPTPRPHAGVGFAVDEHRLGWYLTRVGAVQRTSFEYDRERYLPEDEPELTPLPEELSSSHTVSYILGAVALAGVFLTLVGISNRFFLVIGLITTVVFSIALWVVIQNSPYRRELKRRRQAHGWAANQLRGVERRWSELCESQETRHQSLQQAIAGWVENARGLHAQYSQELAALAAGAERVAREQHMRNHVIATADIPNIGDKLKQLLAANQILTAFDIHPSRIQQIGGFGPDRTTSLLAWQAEVARRFRFDPSVSIPEPHLRSLAAKYHQQQAAIWAEIERGLAELEGLDGETRKQINGLLPELREAVAEWVKAKANLQLIESGE